MTKKPTGRGRPPYQPSIDERVTVEQMKFCGEPNETIARALGIDSATLRKHFPHELENGHANRRKEVIGLLFESARKGNVTAQKRLDEMGRVAGAEASVKAREPKPARLGKKEEQQLAAEKVGGVFATPQPPKLVVSNS